MNQRYTKKPRALINNIVHTSLIILVLTIPSISHADFLGTLLKDVVTLGNSAKQRHARRAAEHQKAIAAENARKANINSQISNLNTQLVALKGKITIYNENLEINKSDLTFLDKELEEHEKLHNSTGKLIDYQEDLQEVLKSLEEKLNNKSKAQSISEWIIDVRESLQSSPEQDTVVIKDFLSNLEKSNLVRNTEDKSILDIFNYSFSYRNFKELTLFSKFIALQKDQIKSKKQRINTKIQNDKNNIIKLEDEIKENKSKTAQLSSRL